MMNPKLNDAVSLILGLFASLLILLAPFGADASRLGFLKSCAANRANREPNPVPRLGDEDKADLIGLMKSASSPTDLLKKMKEGKNGQRFSGFLKSYVLMKRSEANNGRFVTPANPRMIFFGGDTIFAFHGNPKYPDSAKKVEMIQYDKKAHEFRFSLVDYNESPPAITANPARCFRCHGNPPRPLWASYRIWPGVYESPESEFREKYKSKLTDPYALLEKTPYVEPAQALNSFLNELNFDRITHQLAQHPPYRFAAVAALLDCPDFADFLGKAKAEHLKTLKTNTGFSDLAAIHADTLKIGAQRWDDLKASFRELETPFTANENSDDFNDRIDAPKVSKLRFIYEPLGVPVKTFSLAYAPGQNNYGIGFNSANGKMGGLRALLCLLVPPLAETKGPLEKLYEIDPLPEQRAETLEQGEATACALLKDASRSSLEKLAGKGPPQKQAPAKGTNNH